MEDPQVADGGAGLQIRRASTNILNKQSWTAEKEWASSLEVGGVLTIPHLKIHLVTRYYSWSWSWTDSLEGPRQQKTDMRFVTRDAGSP
jgi:hypothetical protein